MIERAAAADSSATSERIMVAAFEGWNDAGESASTAISHLVQAWDAELVAELDPQEYHDFQVNRPLVSTTNGKRTLTWPTTKIYVATAPDLQHEVVLVAGIEPSFRWKLFVAELLGHAEQLEVSLLITLGALLSDVPHTRPIPVTGSSEDPDVRRDFSVEAATYEGPTGIIGALQDAAGARHLPGLSLWAAVPHYVGHSPSPKAVIALLQKVEEVLGVIVPLGSLPDQSQEWEERVSELTTEDSDINNYIRQLEEAKDTADSPDASGEAIAREFERYLRRRNDGHAHGA